MIISPNENRDYKELYDSVINHFINIQAIDNIRTIESFIDIYCSYGKDYTRYTKEYLKILDCGIGLLSKQYTKIINDNDFQSDNSKKMIKFYKIVIYDFFDLRNGIQYFLATQLQSVVRSVVEHTRMYLLCLFDEDFQKYYFLDFNSDSEKKERYHKKKGTKIDKKLESISGTDKNSIVEDSRYYLKTITSTDLYTRIHQEFSELTHMNEFVIANSIISDEPKLDFNKDTTWKYDKYFDDVLEYVIATILLIYRKHIEINTSLADSDSILIHNFLAEIYNKLLTYRGTDYLLTSLKEKVKEIFLSDDE